jgi:hypothetical protein
VAEKSIIDEFFVALGFEVNKEGLKEFEGKTHKLKDAILKVGVATGLAGLGIGAMLKEAIEGMAGVQDFADVHGIAAREVQALGKVAAENDSSLESMQATIGSLGRTTGQAAMGIGRGAMLFKKLHINAKEADGTVKSASTILGEVADKMRGMGTSERLALARSLGIDEKLIPVLSEGREEFEKLVEAARKSNPIQEKSYQLAEKAEKAYKKIISATKVFARQIAADLLPQILELENKFLRWWKDEGPKVLAWLKSSSSKLLEFVDKIKKSNVALTAMKVIVAGLVLIKLGEWISRLDMALTGLAKALAMQNVGAKLWIGLLAVIAAAIILVGQDLWAFSKGMDSLTGRMQRKFPYAIYLVQALLGLLGAAFIATAVKAGLGLGKVVLAIGSMGKAMLASPILPWVALVTIGLLGILSIVKQITENRGAIKDWWADTFGPETQTKKQAKGAAKELSDRKATVNADGTVTYRIGNRMAPAIAPPATAPMMGVGYPAKAHPPVPPASPASTRSTITSSPTTRPQSAAA